MKDIDVGGKRSTTNAGKLARKCAESDKSKTMGFDGMSAVVKEDATAQPANLVNLTIQLNENTPETNLPHHDNSCVSTVTRLHATKAIRETWVQGKDWHWPEWPTPKK